MKKKIKKDINYWCKRIGFNPNNIYFLDENLADVWLNHEPVDFNGVILKLCEKCHGMGGRCVKYRGVKKWRKGCPVCKNVGFIIIKDKK